MVKGIADRTAQQREETVARWAASGLTQAQFCKQEGLSPWLLSDWKKKIKLQQQRETSGKAQRRGSRMGKAYWRKLVAEQAKSELTPRDFCRREGVAFSTFAGWKARLQKKDSSASKNGSRSSSVNPFVEIKCEPMSMVSNTPCAFLDVELSNGAKIRVTDQTPLALLSRVLKALEVSC